MNSQNTILNIQSEKMLNDIVFLINRKYKLKHYCENDSLTSKQIVLLNKQISSYLRDKDILQINKYADKIAKDRHKSGFNLNEILTAINIFQGVFYNYCFKTISQKEMLQNINALNSFFIILKDEISCTYLKLSKEINQNNINIKPLFNGTEAEFRDSL